MNYYEFLDKKRQLNGYFGFKQIYYNKYLFDFQQFLVEWSLKKGRAAIFADCGLGKTLMQLVWAQNIVQKTNKKVLILSPLAVSSQTIKEGEKFGIEVKKSKSGNPIGDITITNYEQLNKFDYNDYSGIVCDESSILKNFNGKIKNNVTQFMKKIKYRSLWTATAAPNDFIELGTSSEALGELGFMDMLSRFFKNDNNTCDIKGKWRGLSGGKHNWRFKGHAEKNFWRWVCSWARAVRKPSDVGFENKNFILPELIENEHIVKTTKLLPGMLIARPAMNFREERFERRNTIEQRCEKAAELCKNNDYTVIWCHLNDEGDYLKKIIKDSIQVSGRDSDDKKEEAYLSFTNGNIKNIIIKPKIGAFGLNWQHCHNIITFATHSYEQYYQAIRRCWRFGQKNKVNVNIILSEGEIRIKENMNRKSIAADRMFTSLVNEMNNSLTINKEINYNKEEKLPLWL